MVPSCQSVWAREDIGKRYACGVAYWVRCDVWGASNDPRVCVLTSWGLTDGAVGMPLQIYGAAPFIRPSLQHFHNCFIYYTVESHRDLASTGTRYAYMRYNALMKSLIIEPGYL
jgi:hypothetical protein